MAIANWPFRIDDSASSTPLISEHRYSPFITSDTRKLNVKILSAVLYRLIYPVVFSATYGSRLAPAVGSAVGLSFHNI